MKQAQEPFQRHQNITKSWGHFWGVFLERNKIFESVATKHSNKLVPTQFTEPSKLDKSAWADVEQITQQNFPFQPGFH